MFFNPPSERDAEKAFDSQNADKPVKISANGTITGSDGKNIKPVTSIIDEQGEYMYSIKSDGTIVETKFEDDRVMKIIVDELEEYEHEC